MDYSDIKSLLDKYWRCETSLDEEAQLRKYFERDDIPEDLQPYTSLFRYFGNISAAEPEKMIDIPLNSGIDEYRHKRPLVRRIQTRWIYRVAAAILILFSVFIIHKQVTPVRKKAVELTRDTYSNPKQALQETRKMLMLISVKLNKGEAQAAKLYEFHEAEDLIRNKNK